MIECNKITKEIKDLMFSLIDKSEIENREHGLILCKEKNGVITSSNICIGTNCELLLEDAKCPVDTTTIGDFHTHPGRGKIPSYLRSRPSVKDTAATASHGRKSLCIGYGHRSKNRVDCYDIIDKNILKLGEKAHDLKNRGEKDNSFEVYKEIYYKVQEIRRDKRSELLNKCSFEQKIK